MKKLLIAALALSLSAGVNAQGATKPIATSGAAGAGGLTVATLTALGVSLAVATAIVANSDTPKLVPGQEFDLGCKAGEGTLVGDICVLEGTTVTVTGTGTATSTISVPVSTTFLPILVPRT